jgi:nucleotide-binding universal stress UspA family protein
MSRAAGRPIIRETREILDRKEGSAMKKILIATDGSPSGLEAVELGLELAAQQGAQVTFVHVASMLDPSGRIPVDAAAALAAARGVLATCEVLAGVPVDEIVAHADTIDADLIVVGSPGALLGSVSRGVLDEARRPVLVVRTAPERAPAPALA